MPTSTTLASLQNLLAELMRCTDALHATLGDTPAMLRVLNDTNAIRNGIQRLQIDVEELAATTTAVPCTATSTALIQISDSEYDVHFWRDVDHEGVGAQSLACTTRHT